MKNFILALIVCACCSVSFADDCCGLRCRQPVRNVVGATVGVTQRVSSVPVRVVRRVVDGVQCRRCNRRCR